MKNKYINILIIIIILIFTYNLLVHRDIVLDSVYSSINIWVKNIFPSLFPFFIVSDVLISYGFPNFLGELLKPLMSKLFKVKGVSSIVFILSMLSGFPGNARNTRRLYDEGLIDSNEASKLLAFTHFSNPLFILGTVSIFLSDKNVGIIILLAHYLSNIFVGLIFRNYYPSKYDNSKVSLKKAFSYLENKKDFGKTFLKAIKGSLETLLSILGIVTIFLVITTVIIEHLNISSLSSTLIKGLFEITGGLKALGNENIPNISKVILSSMMLSFGGLSVHMQIFSQINDVKIKYLPFFIGRILQSIISGILSYLFYVIIL